MSATLTGVTIGIDASRAASDRQTGTERYSRRIIQELLDRGTQQRFRLYVNGTAPLTLAQRADTEQRLIPFPRLWTHLRLSTELALHPVDALFVPAHVVPPVHPAATVVTIHDLGYLHEPGAHTALSRRYLHWSTRWSARAARKIIAISEATKQDLVRFYKVPGEKVTVVYHGVDERFRPAGGDDVARVKRDLAITGPFVLYVGTIQPRKNLVRLIQAFDVLASDNPDLNLVMAGKMGWKTDEITQAAALATHSDRIRVPGHVSDEDLPALYSAAAVFALPSLYEGFGMPVIEAMACGTPVLVSDRGSLPEVAGNAAVVIDPTDVGSIVDGLRSLLDEATRPERIGLGRRNAAMFTWARAGASTLETILSLCPASPA